MSFDKNFDIRNYIWDLEAHPKKPNKYKCPNCDTFKLTISPSGSQYKCWGCEDTAAIARILTEPERAERRRQTDLTATSKSKPKLKSQRVKGVSTSISGGLAHSENEPTELHNLGSGSPTLSENELTELDNLGSDSLAANPNKPTKLDNLGSDSPVSSGNEPTELDNLGSDSLTSSGNEPTELDNLGSDSLAANPNEPTKLNNLGSDSLTPSDNERTPEDFSIPPAQVVNQTPKLRKKQQSTKTGHTKKAGATTNPPLNPPRNPLDLQHVQHLLEEGFTIEEITKFHADGEICSLSAEDALLLGFKVWDGQQWISSAGLFMRFTPTFGQLRLDNPIVRPNGSIAKYLTPVGYKAEAMLPNGCEVITEGWKDAKIATLRSGIPTGAVAGVSHVRKALPQNSRLITLFDADGRLNPSVFSNLFYAGEWLHSKIQLLPEIAQFPKAGLCEYFKAGHTADDYRKLIDSALTPEAFLLKWPLLWANMPDHRRSTAVRVSLKIASFALGELEQDELIKRIAKTTGSVTKLRAILNRYLLPFQQKASQEQFQNIQDKLKQEYQSSWSNQAGVKWTDFSTLDDVPNFDQASIANYLAAKYNKYLAWHTGIKEWYFYGASIPGIWQKEKAEFIKKLVIDEVNILAEFKAITKKSKKDETTYTDNFINGILGLLKPLLSVKSWNCYGDLIPFFNGVLNRSTKTFSAHKPENNINWCLPYQYNPKADCPQIQQWMHEMCEGDTQLVQLLRAYLNAIVNRRACDFHRYLEIIGPGGTGKSTFMNLAMAMVGKENVLSTSFKKLETSRFETANLEGKLLALLTDSERYAGEISTFKAMTGGDPIPYEQKFKQATEGFVFNGMVIVAANEIVQCSDYTSGLKRRRISIRMNTRIEPKYQRNLIRYESQQNCFTGEFVPELPGLMNWVLGMADVMVSNYIKRTDEFVLSLSSVEKETLISTNPIATWVDHCLVLRSGYKTYIGRAPQEKDRSNPDHYQFAGRWLYPSYAEFSRATGHSVVSLNRFVTNLHDLLINQLRLKDVVKGSDNQGSFWMGIKIRTLADSDPFIITGNPLPPSPPSGPSGIKQPVSPKPAAPGGIGVAGSAVSHAAQVATLERRSVDNVNGDNSTSLCDDGMTTVMTPVMTQTFTQTDCDDCDGFFKKSTGVSDNNFDGVSGKLVEEISSSETANIGECSKTIDLSGVGSSLGSSPGSSQPAFCEDVGVPVEAQPACGDVGVPVEAQPASNGDVQVSVTSEPACNEDVGVPVESQPASNEVEMSVVERLKTATTGNQINQAMFFLSAQMKVRAWQLLSVQQQQQTARVIASSLQQCQIQEDLQKFCCLPALVKTQVWALLSDSQKQRLQNLPKWVSLPSNINIKGLSKWLIELDSVENGRIFASANAMAEFYGKMESWYNHLSESSRHTIYISGFWERATAVFTARIFDDVRDCLFRVRQVVGTHIDPQIIWIENCRLIDVPAPPHFNFYKFVTADGQTISAAGADSFEVMEVDA